MIAQAKAKVERGLNNLTKVTLLIIDKSQNKVHVGLKHVNHNGYSFIFYLKKKKTLEHINHCITSSLSTQGYCSKDSPHSFSLIS